jgi:hypothetical protein
VGASRVVKPKWSGVANAIGAATARVSGVIDSVESTESRTQQEILSELSQRATDKVVANGALRESVIIAEMETFPLQVLKLSLTSSFVVNSLTSWDSISLTSLGLSSKPLVILIIPVQTLRKFLQRPM